MWGQRSLSLLRHDRSRVQGAREGRVALSQKRWAGAKGPAERPPTHPSWSAASGGEHRSSPGEEGGEENKVLGALPENIPRASPGRSQDPSRAPRGATLTAERLHR